MVVVRAFKLTSPRSNFLYFLFEVGGSSSWRRLTESHGSEPKETLDIHRIPTARNTGVIVKRPKSQDIEGWG